ncbi:MAG: hypothetical protein Q7T84_00985 [Phenylobacterium sp.]|nr:hypothetical protein [Phenylobacterium sp.]
MADDTLQPLFQSSPITDYQVIVANDRPVVPDSYVLNDLDGVWVANGPQFRTTQVYDAEKQPIGLLVGIAYNVFEGDFVKSEALELPILVRDIDDIELLVLPKLAGSFLLVTAKRFPRRVYPDHGGSISMVYISDRRIAASSPALLLSEAEYTERFDVDLHDALVVREGGGGWISGTLTAHRGVLRLLANHYLDLESWQAARFWPRLGEFDGWRDMGVAAADAADAIRTFNDAVFRSHDVAVTLTAGFDTRLVLAGCREHISAGQFFTIAAPLAEMDMAIGQRIALRFGLNFEILPLKRASKDQAAVWDRMVGDCVLEAPRFTHPTLRDLKGRDVIVTGLFGETGRCRYYRQDLLTINDSVIDAKFIVDRLTVPAHPVLVKNIDKWLRELDGQPNSVILDLALLELKLGSWAMPQRSMTNTVKWAFMPFTQRVVFDAFVGVAPADKGTAALFWAMIRHLWPNLDELPINKYGDVRDYTLIWKKLTNPARVRRYLRDRFAKKTVHPVSSGA